MRYTTPLMNEIDWIVDYEIPMDIAREELTISRRFRAEWSVLLKTLAGQNAEK